MNVRKKIRGVIIVPDEGYTSSLYRKAASIYFRSGQIPIIISGADRDPIIMKSYGIKKRMEGLFQAIPIKKQMDLLHGVGVNEDHIIHENKSLHTRENALNSLMIIREKMPDTKVIYLVSLKGSLLRKYLTFEKARRELSLNVEIKIRFPWGIWPLHVALGQLIMIPGELLRIYKYRKLGHL